MEIRGPLYSPYPQIHHDPSAQRQPTAEQHNPNQAGPQNSLPVRSVRSVAPNRQAESDGNANQRRFYNRDVDLPRSSQQALGQYQSADMAGGPELLNRVDVFA